MFLTVSGMEKGSGMEKFSLSTPEPFCFSRQPLPFFCAVISVRNKRLPRVFCSSAYPEAPAAPAVPAD